MKLIHYGATTIDPTRIQVKNRGNKPLGVLFACSIDADESWKDFASGWYSRDLSVEVEFNVTPQAKVLTVNDEADIISYCNGREIDYEAISLEYDVVHITYDAATADMDNVLYGYDIDQWLILNASVIH